MECRNLHVSQISRHWTKVTWERNASMTTSVSHQKVYLTEGRVTESLFHIGRHLDAKIVQIDLYVAD
jgi:hypothetical protein